MNDKRVIPDGAHHSGLMKDYGGRYNPDYQSELDRLRQRENELVYALTEAISTTTAIRDLLNEQQYPEAGRRSQWKQAVNSCADEIGRKPENWLGTLLLR